MEFKGANLWILIFAIFMASLGLNVNSTAVIIGAMLISPLMGPIMGVGAFCRLERLRTDETFFKEFSYYDRFQCDDGDNFSSFWRLLPVRSQSYWPAHRRQFMTYSSHFSVVWQVWWLFLRKKKGT